METICNEVQWKSITIFIKFNKLDIDFQWWQSQMLFIMTQLLFWQRAHPSELSFISN